jgi:hypothetical protein
VRAVGALRFKHEPSQTELERFNRLIAVFGKIDRLPVVCRVTETVSGNFAVTSTWTDSSRMSSYELNTMHTVMCALNKETEPSVVMTEVLSGVPISHKDLSLDFPDVEAWHIFPDGDKWNEEGEEVTINNETTYEQN